ncbi:MAG: VapE family protein [Prolixibacteraceae bacterium]|nr:VapE family protein [Prolixibacteraceae bacterium]
MRNEIEEKKSLVSKRRDALRKVVDQMKTDRYDDVSMFDNEAGEFDQQIFRDYLSFSTNYEMYPDDCIYLEDEGLNDNVVHTQSNDNEQVTKNSDTCQKTSLSEELSRFKDFDLSIFPVSSQKLPFGKWKQFQTEIAPTPVWYDHFNSGGYVGIITGKVSGNLEVIDIDVKNDPSRTIFAEYKSVIPEDLYSRLLVQTTVNAGFHLIYRCPDAVIDGNQKLALSEANEVIIETRGEGGYICHHLRDYKVIQGNFNLISGEADIPVITPKEREMLLTLARSLTRKTTEKNSKSTFTYKDQAIIDFNDKYSVLDLFCKCGWTIYSEDETKVTLSRPDSNALYSGYYYKDTKTFMCFSTSTGFAIQKPQNHFQILQVLEKISDYRQAIRRINELGFGSAKTNEKIKNEDVATYLNGIGVRYDSFRQDLIYNGDIISEMTYNTIFLDMLAYFGKDIARQRFEDVIKSNYISHYNPIQEFVEKYGDRKPVGMFEQWLDCIELKNKDIPKSTVIHFLRKWYVGLIAQALDGDFANEFFLTLLSTEQGIGKTTLLRKYTIPEVLQNYRVEHALSFDDDFKVLMGQALLVIDDEMDGRTYEAEKTFKTILSTKELTTRRKYDRRISTIKRRCSFAGSGNNLNVIRERQNRRIIPIEIAGIDHDKIRDVDLIDLFMEAYNLFMKGYQYSYQYSDKPLLVELYQDYMQQSDIDLILDEYVDLPSGIGDFYYVTNLDIVTYLTKIFPNSSKRINVPTIGKQMAERGFKTIRKGSKKMSCYQISSFSKIIRVLDDYAQSHQIN